MKIRRLRLRGLESFSDTDDIALSDGFNVIIGQNNVGKSAIVRALKLERPFAKHKSISSFRDQLLPAARIEADIIVSNDEFKSMLFRRDRMNMSLNTHYGIEAAIDDLLTRDEIKYSVEFGSNYVKLLSPPSYIDPSQTANEVQFEISNGEIGVNGFSNGDESAHFAEQIFRENTFVFNAERYNLSTAPAVHSPRLSPDASNLASTVFTMAGEQGSRWQTVLEIMRDIFPTVGDISVRPVPQQNNLVELRVWPTTQRDDVELSFPLSKSGTGISQVLAILVAAMTNDNAVLVIDELSNFLHPHATKALMTILQTDFNKLQYIVTTHSPEVIGFRGSSSLFLVRRSGYESYIQRLEGSIFESFENIASELGISMGEVLSADRIVWVEGPTEEICFPYLYRRSATNVSSGLHFISVAAPGDLLRKKEKELIARIYERLTSATGSLSHTVSFCLDREKLDDRAIEDLTRTMKGKLTFLPRRQIENYLIDGFVIAKFMNSKSTSADLSYTIENAIVAIETKAAQLCDHLDAYGQWRTTVDATKLIKEVVLELSGGTIFYAKVEDTLKLIQIAYDANTRDIGELAEFVVNLVENMR